MRLFYPLANDVVIKNINSEPVKLVAQIGSDERVYFGLETTQVYLRDDCMETEKTLTLEEFTNLVSLKADIEKLANNVVGIPNLIKRVAMTRVEALIAINTYLSQNKIKDTQYQATHLVAGMGSSMEVHLDRNPGSCLMGYFEPDPNWLELTKQIAVSMGVCGVSVPSWYYAK